MKQICFVLLAFIFSIELHAQPFPLHRLSLYTEQAVKENLSNISIGLGFAEAIRFTSDEHNRNHDLRFLANVNMTLKVYHPLFVCFGLEYSEKDLDGNYSTLNLSVLPSLTGNAFNGKVD
jgi:hypothetical protein